MIAGLHKKLFPFALSSNVLYVVLKTALQILLLYHDDLQRHVVNKTIPLLGTVKTASCELFWESRTHPYKLRLGTDTEA